MHFFYKFANNSTIISHLLKPLKRSPAVLIPFLGDSQTQSGGVIYSLLHRLLSKHLYYTGPFKHIAYSAAALSTLENCRKCRNFPARRTLPPVHWCTHTLSGSELSNSLGVPRPEPEHPAACHWAWPAVCRRSVGLGSLPVPPVVCNLSNPVFNISMHQQFARHETTVKNAPRVSCSRARPATRPLTCAGDNPVLSASGLIVKISGASRVLPLGV